MRPNSRLKTGLRVDAKAMTYSKRLIEVAPPIRRISAHSQRDRLNRKGGGL